MIFENGYDKIHFMKEARIKSICTDSGKPVTTDGLDELRKHITLARAFLGREIPLPLEPTPESQQLFDEYKKTLQEYFGFCMQSLKDRRIADLILGTDSMKRISWHKVIFVGQVFRSIYLMREN